MVSRTRSIGGFSRRPHRATRLTFERLEQRQLLAADAFSATKPLLEEPLTGGSYHYWADGKKIDLAPIEGQFILGTKAGHNVDMAELLNFALCGEDFHVGDTQLFQNKYLIMESVAELDWNQFLAGAESSLELAP